MNSLHKIQFWGGVSGLIITGLPAHEGLHSGGHEMPPLLNRVEIEITDQYRIFSVDSLPDHTHGRFPNAGNPHSITPQSERFRIPLIPQPLDRPRPLAMGAFGIALNGILFEPAAAEFWQSDRRSGWQFEALGHHLDLGVDDNHAHVQPTGKYHYHGMPNGLIENVDGTENFALLGYAADGYPIYTHWSYRDPTDSNSPLEPLRSSFRLKTGQRPDGPKGDYDGKFVQDYEYVEGLGDLDIANGRNGVTPEYPQGTYYYVITPEFPFIPRYWWGQLSPDFGQRPGGNGDNAGGRAAGGPRPPDLPNRPPQGAGSQFPTLSALRDSDLLTSLRLGGEQSVGLNEMLANLETLIRRGRTRPPNASPDELSNLRHELKSTVDAQIEQARSQWLDAAQNKLLDQYLNRQQGVEILLREDVHRHLSLSPAQFETIYNAIVQGRAADAADYPWTDALMELDESQIARLLDVLGPWH